MSWKQTVWRIMPAGTHGLLREFYFFWRLLPECIYDFRRFLRYSGLNKSRELPGEQAAQIVLAYHQIEKGLSLGAPRPGFGADTVERLLRAISRFVALNGWRAPATTGMRVLQEYVAFNEAAGLDMSVLRARLHASCVEISMEEAGGTLALTREELVRQCAAGFDKFFSARHSIRQFSGGEVSEAQIREAVRIAQRTPSVCNRQAWRVHAFRRAEDMQAIMPLQGGSRGFGEQAGALLVLTCDLAFFVDVGERYQAWIDGGMFSMSLCLALHAQGLGTCCLAWSKDRKTDLRMRELIRLPEGEQIIMLMAVGTLPEAFRVAASPRRALDDMLSFDELAHAATQGTVGVH